MSQANNAPLFPKPYREDGIPLVQTFPFRSTAARHNPVVILIAEDNSDDMMFIRLAFRKARLSVAVHHAQDGQCAMNYLRGTYGYYNRRKFPLPQLLVSAAQMPAVNGLELLKWVRGTEPFEQLPVIMLSGSDVKNHEQRANELGVTTFIQKDVFYKDPACLCQAVKTCFPQCKP